MKKGEKTLRKDKRFNQIAIRNELLRSIEENGYIPSEKELSKATGLSVQAISRHINEMDFEADKDFYKMFTPEVVMNIKKSSERHPASQKLWLQVIEGWNEKTSLSVTFDSKEAKERFESIYPNV